MNFEVGVVDRVKDLADPELILELLGFRITKRSSRELRAACLLHGGDNPTAFRMNVQTKRFCCYTKQCHMASGETDNDLVTLVMKAKGTSFKASVMWLAEVLGVDLDGLQTDSEALVGLYRTRHMRRVVEEVSRQEAKSSPLPELPLSDLGTIGGFDFFSMVGIPAEEQQAFNVGFKVYADGVPRATIPVYDDVGRLVGISGRRIDGDEEPRYQLSYGFDKMRVLYNLNQAKGFSGVFNNTIIVVEGFKAAWAVHAAGYSNVVACMGAFLLDSQAEMLSEVLPAVHCLVMMDGDKAGAKGQKSSVSAASRYFRTVSINLRELHPDKSPDDLTPTELDALFEGLM